MSIKELKAKRAALDAEIIRLETIEKRAEKSHILMLHYCQVACPDCDATGETSTGGADIISDPPDSEPCRACHGKGWLYARKWEGNNARHLMDYNEVCAP